MCPQERRIDVVRIMREIREEARARQNEIERRIDRARKQVAEQIPELSEDRLRQAVERLNEIFDRYFAQMAEYLLEQEPNLENIRHTLLEINRLIADPDPPPGRRDRWWNPWFLIKRAIAPLRRFVLRRQYELNALMRDTLAYLVNHSAHLKTQRMSLEMGVQLMQVTNTLLGQGGMMRRYFEEWPKLSLNPILEYLADALERQAEEMQTLTRDFLLSRTDEIARQGGARLDRMERQIAAIDPGKAGALMGFESYRHAEAARGSEETLRDRQKRYLKYLWGLDNVMDAGCGRGEFLEVLREGGVPAYGVDADKGMVDRCKEKGLDAHCEDVLDHLAALPDESLGGLVAFQLIEHFDFPRLFQFVREAGRTVRSGGTIILETVNPSCLTVFSGALYADPTHQRPIHSQAARELLEVAGFEDFRIEHLSPTAEADRLVKLDEHEVSDPATRKAIAVLNHNFERLNSVLYGFADYAIIGKKSKAA